MAEQFAYTVEIDASLATGELLASKTIRPNDIVALTSVGFVDSVIILGTTYRLVPTWTNIACP